MIFSTLAPLKAFAYDEGFFAANDILFYNPDDCTAATSGTGGGGGLVSGGNEAKIWCYLLSNGLSKNGAAGVMGNMGRETGGTFQPNLWQRGGFCNDKRSNECGYGLVQWTWQTYKWDNTGPMKTLWKFADEQFPNTSGKVGTLQTQLDYLLYTLEKNRPGLLATLKKPDPTVEDQAFNFFTGYEMPNATRGDSNNVIGTRNALKAYSQHHNLPCGTTSVATPPPPTTPPSSATAATTTSGGQTVVIIDPGHANSTPHKDSPDPAGLIDINSANTPEMKNMFDVAKLVQTKLNTDGYKALLTKDTNDSVPTSYERAKFADSNNGDIALSIHTYSGFPGSGFGSYGEIYPQKVGEYRTTTTGTDVKFTNADTATKSQRYAKKFKAARSVNENGVIIKDNSFDGRSGIAPGNLAIVQLISNVPWVYNESDAMTGSVGLSSSDKQKYADGLIKGVKDSIGPNAHSGGSTSTDTNGCDPSSGLTGTAGQKIVQVAKEELRKNGGTLEYAPEILKYTMGRQEAWCADFSSWVLKTAGVPFKDGVGEGGWNQAGVPGIYAEGQKNHLIGDPHSPENYIPKPGDLALHIGQHVNIVITVNESNHTFTIIGGNQSDTVSTYSENYKNQSNLLFYKSGSL